MLDVRLSSQLGAFTLDVAASVPDRSVLVLVGESGAGKTTLLRLLAGLARPDHGRIEVDGAVWYDGSAGTCIPPEGRAVGYVPQDYALFPHLTVAENVAFGLRALGIPARQRRDRVQASLTRLHVESLADRRPNQLSGGQQQRVAIARAIVLEPALLLLDEPLSALDVTTRRTIRGELRQLLGTLPCTTVYVTHHPAEALVLGERIAVLESGRITQSGSPEHLMRRPQSAFVAEFLGVNLLRGVVTATADGLTHVAIDGGEVLVPHTARTGEVAVLVHPREITITLERPAGSARNVFAGTIEELVPEPPDGALVRVSLRSSPRLVAEVTRDAVAALALAPGGLAYAAFKAAAVVVQ